MTLALTTDGHDLVLIVDVVGHELVGLDVTHDVNRCGVDTVARILQTLVVVTCPEEGDCAVGDQFAHHV